MKVSFKKADKEMTAETKLETKFSRERNPINSEESGNINVGK
jgi:hypothetical protein